MSPIIPSNSSFSSLPSEFVCFYVSTINCIIIRRTIQFLILYFNMIILFVITVELIVFYYLLMSLFSLKLTA